MYPDQWIFRSKIVTNALLLIPDIICACLYLVSFFTWRHFHVRRLLKQVNEDNFHRFALVELVFLSGDILAIVFGTICFLTLLRAGHLFRLLRDRLHEWRRDRDATAGLLLW
jgi:hypothetical protein